MENWGLYFTLESLRALEKINFGILHGRLIVLVKGRIHNGEYTERGLARLLGVSQPQLHNVLKGARRLNPDLADRMMARLGVTALELLEVAELEIALAMHRNEQSWLHFSAMPESSASEEGERLSRIRRPPAASSRERRWETG